MKILPFMLVWVFIAGCVSNSPHQALNDHAERINLAVLPQPGSPFHPGAQPSHLELMSSGSAEPAYWATLHGTNFVVAVSRDDVVRYVATTDARFFTPEGIHVGSPLATVLAAGAAVPMAEPGWGFHALLPSHWSVAFTNGAGLSGGPLPADAKVVWLFQR